MVKTKQSTTGLLLALTMAGCSTPQPQDLQTQGLTPEGKVLTKVKSIEFSGNGRWFQFGQAPNPNSSWPPFAVSKYQADIDFEKANAVVKIVRTQIVEPERNRPSPVEQRVEQYLSGQTAWNIAATGSAPAATTAQPTAVEERQAEILATPQGFLKATLENNANEESVNGGKEISFTVGGKYRYVGFLNDKHQLQSVKTWIDNPVLGDTLVETHYSDYKDFGGVQFPGHILRSQGGFPVLDIDVTSVTLNPNVEVVVPPEAAKPAALAVKSEALAKGVYYLTGGTHHSVAIEQTDHVVVVEAPLNEARSVTVIEKVREIIPNKPIKYLINTHAHFDHSGGLRTFVDAGATIITAEANKPYYEKVWAAPRSINPDRLAKSQRTAHFETVPDKYVFSDGKRKIEIHSIAGNSHNDAFLLVYLPKEKILIEADAFTLPAANAPALAKPNPYSVNLDDNIQNLHLKVDKIAGLHGARVATLQDLHGYIGREHAAN